ncbi:MULTISPECIES: hypothetical protein [unclassified Phyllobacterium]|uniref:hypothetical protein n=1 Tax=Phyllobacterium TaxID=28100 RepID=UPI0013AECB5D|nr:MULTISPECIES: hypothetical protein [unclassified Phyllobacterium]MBA8902313.1 hypothetical protein [Phyllobacterium sp. P30BS-XVII]UGX87048.1 hypothetical protein LLE53_004140 [Phyllobacterium sp. T1293]
MPILLLLPIAALIAVWAAMAGSKRLRYPILILGAFILAVWLWYLFALIQMDLPD